MTLAEIARLRVDHQQLAATKLKTPKELVRWMGAMQAQDYPMAKWAVGIRLPHVTDAMIEAAVDKGDIIRTHVMRPTWHFVSAEDFHWMLALTASRIKSSLKARHRELELSEAVLAKSRKVLERALADGSHLTREELADHFKNARIDTNDQRLYHLLFRAELDGILCSGTSKGIKRTYALLHSRVRRQKHFTKEESLVELAMRYFTSHGPASFLDFAWWSGLSMPDARHAFESVKSKFLSDTIGTEIYLFNGANAVGSRGRNSVFLLPAYDEFLISYRERSASLSMVDNKKAISNNGIFYPVIVVDGQVAGVWKRKITKKSVVVETNFFRSMSKSIRTRIEDQGERFGRFLNMDVEVKHKAP
jgi:hypothetical protein